MATQIINEFAQFNMTDAETLAGQTFSVNQLMMLTNLRADYAIKRIKLNYTPEQHQQFLQQEAEISGWMNCISYLIECHEAAQQLLVPSEDSEKPESTGDASAIFTS